MSNNLSQSHEVPTVRELRDPGEIDHSLAAPNRPRVDSIGERVFDDEPTATKIAGKALDFSALYATDSRLADTSFWMTHEPPGTALY